MERDSSSRAEDVCRREPRDQWRVIMAWHLLWPENRAVAQSPGGFSIGDATGAWCLRTEPLDLFWLNSDVDSPEWVDPRMVSLHGLPRPVVGQPRRVASRRPRRRRVVADIRALRRHLSRVPLWDLCARLPHSAHPFLVLWVAQRIETYEQLLRAAPFLATLAVGGEQDLFHVSLDELLTAIREACLVSRREFVTHLGLPAAATTGLCKVSPAASDPLLLPSVQASLQDPEILKSLVHMPVVGPDAMYVIARPPLFRRVRGGFLAPNGISSDWC